MPTTDTKPFDDELVSPIMTNVIVGIVCVFITVLISLVIGTAKVQIAMKQEWDKGFDSGQIAQQQEYAIQEIQTGAARKIDGRWVVIYGDGAYPEITTAMAVAKAKVDQAETELNYANHKLANAQAEAAVAEADARSKRVFEESRAVQRTKCINGVKEIQVRSYKPNMTEAEQQDRAQYFSWLFGRCWAGSL